MKQIYEFETIEQLTGFLNSVDKGKIRKQLFEEFDRLFHYKNLKEWNELVRVCEALAILYTFKYEIGRSHRRVKS